MGLLDIASSRTVSRGYDYYLDDYVKDVRQINDYEYEGYVKGSLNEPYFVHINIKHPKKSYCNCPFANGNRICKHMVALYFTVFEDEANEYEEWLNSSYDDEYDDYDEYEYDDYPIENNFTEPLFFNQVLDNYLDSLSVTQLKTTLKEILLRDKESTYFEHLKDYYKVYLGQNRSDLYFLDYLNNKIQNIISFHDYDYQDFSQKILTRKDKEKLIKLYNEKQNRSVIEQMILKPKLAVFDDYRHIILSLKNQIEEKTLKTFSELLTSYFDTLKSYRIRNTIPKSNVLIILDMINNYTINNQAESLLRNAKYKEYIEYLIKNTSDVNLLYKSFIQIIQMNYFKNKEYIPDILLAFYVNDEENQEKFKQYMIYKFLANGDLISLKHLMTYHDFDEIFHELESKIKKPYLLAKLYASSHKIDKLWSLLNKDYNQNYLYKYVEELKDEYQDKLYKTFIDHFYETLKGGKSREVYRKAVEDIKAIYKLNDGNQLVDSIIEDLKNSEYKKCVALFDEIKKAYEVI